MNKVYYEDKIYFGRNRLYQYIKDNYPDSGITSRGINDWLRRQKLSQLFTPAQKTKDLKRTVLKKPNSIIAIDLIDMGTKEYDGYKWILSAIDLFSKKGFAIALRNKEDKTVADGMNTILKTMKDKPSRIRSDNGSEFISKEFQALEERNNIKHIFSKASSPQSNGNIENFNKILKRLIEMDRVHTDNSNWVLSLPKLLEAYNETPSRITGIAPNKVDQDNTKDVAMSIEKNVLKNTKQNEPEFSVGNIVRIKMIKEKFSKSFENWSRELFQVIKVIKPQTSSVFAPSYKLMDSNGKELKEVFYNQDLQLVQGLEGKVAQPEKYIISKLVELKIIKGKPFYEVKWRNYPENTVEPRSQLILDVPKMVAKFEKDNDIKI